MTSDEEQALADIPHLKFHVQKLIKLSAKIFSSPRNFDNSNHLAFMTLTFAAKQTEHAQSVLVLDHSADTILIVRSMFEGLCQLLWAGQAPAERPLQWRTFSFVLDWRLLQQQLRDGKPVEVDQRTHIENGIQEYGKLFWTAKAREAKAKALALPDDPYTKNWYGEKEKEIFEAVGADEIYKKIYGPFSEWHHWRIGAFGQLMKYDHNSTTFEFTTRHASYTAMALAGAFQCLWQTLSFLEEIAPNQIRDDLDRLRASCVSIRGASKIDNEVQ